MSESSNNSSNLPKPTKLRLNPTRRLVDTNRYHLDLAQNLAETTRTWRFGCVPKRWRNPQATFRLGTRKESWRTTCPVPHAIQQRSGRDSCTSPPACVTRVAIAPTHTYTFSDCERSDPRPVGQWPPHAPGNQTPWFRPQCASHSRRLLLDRSESSHRVPPDPCALGLGQTMRGDLALPQTHSRRHQSRCPRSRRRRWTRRTTQIWRHCLSRAWRLPWHHVRPHSPHACVGPQVWILCCRIQVSSVHPSWVC